MQFFVPWQFVDPESDLVGMIMASRERPCFPPGIYRHKVKPSLKVNFAQRRESLSSW